MLVFVSYRDQRNYKNSYSDIIFKSVALFGSETDKNHHTFDIMLEYLQYTFVFLLWWGFSKINSNKILAETVTI